MQYDIDELIEFIDQNLFNDVDYPELKDADEKQRLLFHIRHSGLHFSKTAGKIAAVSEDADHGGELAIDSIKENTAKSLINTLRLARLVGMTQEELIAFIEKRSKN